MKSGAWIALGGAAAMFGGLGLLAWGRVRHEQCMLHMTEAGGSPNPFQCMDAGWTQDVVATILTPLGVLGLLVGGGIAMVQYGK